MSQKQKCLLFWIGLALLLGLGLFVSRFVHWPSSHWSKLILGLAYAWAGLADLLDFHPSKRFQAKSKTYRRLTGATMLILASLWFLMLFFDRQFAPLFWILLLVSIALSLWAWIQGNVDEEENIGKG